MSRVTSEQVVQLNLLFPQKIPLHNPCLQRSWAGLPLHHSLPQLILLPLPHPQRHPRVEEPVQLSLSVCLVLHPPQSR